MSTMFLLPGSTLISIGAVLIVLWLLTLIGIWRTVRNSAEILEMVRDAEEARNDPRVTNLDRR
jgi:hypothetical protein